MPSLKALKTRKNGVQSIAKITHVMKLVSVSKLRRAQTALDKSRSYIKQIIEIMLELKEKLEPEGIEDLKLHLPIFLGKETGVKKSVILAVGSEKGLCSAFNNNLAKKIIRDAHGLLADKKAVKITCIGNKIYKALKPKLKKEVELEFIDYKINSKQDISELREQIVEDFRADKFDECFIYYTKFVSTIKQNIVSKPLLPLQSLIEFGNEEEEKKEKVNIQSVPTASVLIRRIAERFLDGLLYAISLDAQASEHASRMVAMDNASNNANDLIEDLNTMYNKQRQSSITTELIEIISGAESLKAH